MIRAKLCSFAIATVIGSMAFVPTTAYAMDKGLEPVIVSESSNIQKELKAAFEQKMQKANETWKTLTKEQRNEIYSMLESEIKIEVDILNKLVEFGILEKQDAELLGKYMIERLEDVKKSEDFPLFRQGGKKKIR